jgi:hypothetical protein
MFGSLIVPDLVVPPRLAGSFTPQSIRQLLTFDLHSSIPILPLRIPSSMYHGQGTVTMLGLAGEAVVLALEAAAAADLEVDLGLAGLGVWTILEGRSVKAAGEVG